MLVYINAWNRFTKVSMNAHDYDNIIIIINFNLKIIINH